MEKLRIAVLASGRGSNLQAIIDAIESGKIKGVKIEVVISDNPKAYALIRAKKHNLEALCIPPKGFSTREDYDREIIKELKKRKVKLVVLAGFMRLLSPYFVREYRNRIMNIHPALLPAFPGLHAQRKALEYGVKIAGCTVHFVDEGCDTGPVILQEAVPVKDDDTEETLSNRILAKEHQIYPKAISLFAEGRIELIGRRTRIKDAK
jgi:phosphoribosylglycinamide formyltransferase-1